MARHRLLVSGANGFVGSILAEMVISHPHASEILLAPLASPLGEAIDIRDAPAVERAVADFQPTAVIHLAAIASPHQARQNPHEAWSVNVMGTFNLAQAVRDHAEDARFVFAGSSEAYGASFQNAVGPLDEEARLDPVSLYGATKAAADLMLAQMARQGLKATRFRPFNHTGPGQPAHYVLPSFARQIVRIEKGWQEPVIRVGNLNVRRDFLDVRDVAAAYLTSALKPESSGLAGAFNLATGSPIEIGALLDMLLKATDASVSVEVDPKLTRPNEFQIVSGDPGKANAVLGWKAELDLEQTVRKVLDYWRSLSDSDSALISPGQA